MPSQPPKWIAVILPVLLGVNLGFEFVAFDRMFPTANTMQLPVVSIVAFFFFLFTCVLYLLFMFFMYPQR